MRFIVRGVGLEFYGCGEVEVWRHVEHLELDCGVGEDCEGGEDGADTSHSRPMRLFPFESHSDRYTQHISRL